jgi:UDP-N-acetylglucosamine--N-acetylmuramyl-(pentapeptide) pyrophosphoryl-undecaprenol N-acetylglucosamine transferase
VRILLSGGGTAGHIYPALSVAEHLLAEGHEVAFAGTPDGLEARLVPEAGIDFFAVPSRGFDRSRPFTLVTSSAVMIAALARAGGALRRFRPDAVLGFGGYVSLPVGLAAVLARVPLALHEQNSLPGLANRVLSRWAREVGVTYESSLKHLGKPERVRVTGNPVRPAVLGADRRRGRATLGVPDEATLLLVFGGSRGARHLNETLLEMAPALMKLPGVHVVHSTGRQEHATVERALAARTPEAGRRYRVVPYIDTMGDALAAADLVVSRAGATSIAEITAVGRPAVLVPYPYATDDHQTLNARAVAQAGGAVVVADAALGQTVFADAVLRLLHDPARRERMAESAAELARPDATADVAELALRAAREGRERR